MDPLLRRVGEIGLVPVIKLDSAARAVGLGRALLRGGIPVAEVTFRTAAAADAIRAMSAELPDLLVGAGTVLTLDQAALAIRAGARFIVSPCYVDEVVAYCQERGVPVLPGVVNPDGVAKGLAAGLEVLKFFPAGASGGTAMLDALSGPFGAVKFIPTGGIDTGNLASYARRASVLAIGGSWMVRPELVEAENWAEVERLCRAAVAALHGFAFAHLGIGCADDPGRRALAGMLERLFNFPGEERDGSLFAGDRIELTCGRADGKGQIAIRCNQMERALAYLAGAGIQALPGTATPRSVQLDLELGGFAFHLVRG